MTRYDVSAGVFAVVPALVVTQVTPPWWAYALIVAVCGALVTVFVLALCRIAGEADEHEERMADDD
jgi:uncharacterized membrane protein YeaQ/YmgE (transglycosylase-associated protein family)